MDRSRTSGDDEGSGGNMSKAPDSGKVNGTGIGVRIIKKRKKSTGSFGWHSPSNSLGPAGELPSAPATLKMLQLRLKMLQLRPSEAPRLESSISVRRHVRSGGGCVIAGGKRARSIAAAAAAAG